MSAGQPVRRVEANATWVSERGLVERTAIATNHDDAPIAEHVSDALAALDRLGVPQDATGLQVHVYISRRQAA